MFGWFRICVVLFHPVWLYIPCVSYVSMGAGSSVETKLQPRSRLVTSVIGLKPHQAQLVAANTQWRLTDPSSETKTVEQELLALLNDPVGQKHIGAFAKKIMTSETFFCWVEIKEFREAPSFGYRKSLAKLIYKKYIKTGAPMALGSITSEIIDYYDVSKVLSSHLDITKDCIL